MPKNGGPYRNTPYPAPGELAATAGRRAGMAVPAGTKPPLGHKTGPQRKTRRTIYEK